MATGQASCFFPNGDLVTPDAPCFPEAKVSSCCRREHTCLPNGLCYGPVDKILSRGTCTDPKWESPDCPQYCTQNEYTGKNALDFSNGGVPVWSCSNKWAAEGGLMCCDRIGSTDSIFNGTCCSGVGAVNLFSLGSTPGLVTPTPTPLPSSSPSISIPSSSTAAPPPTATSSSAVFDPSVERPSLSSSTLHFSPSTSLSPTSSSAANPNPPTGNGRTIAVAVGTSIGSAMLLIAIFLFYHQRRRRRRERQQVQNMDQVRNLSNKTYKIPRRQETYVIPRRQEFVELAGNARAIRQELPE